MASRKLFCAGVYSLMLTFPVPPHLGHWARSSPSISLASAIAAYRSFTSSPDSLTESCWRMARIFERSSLVIFHRTACLLHRQKRRTSRPAQKHPASSSIPQALGRQRFPAHLPAARPFAFLARGAAEKMEDGLSPREHDRTQIVVKRLFSINLLSHVPILPDSICASARFFFAHSINSPQCFSVSLSASARRFVSAGSRLSA